MHGGTLWALGAGGDLPGLGAQRRCDRPREDGGHAPPDVSPSGGEEDVNTGGRRSYSVGAARPRSDIQSATVVARGDGADSTGRQTTAAIASSPAAVTPKAAEPDQRSAR